jgi:hypothetical protein
LKISIAIGLFLLCMVGLSQSPAYTVISGNKDIDEFPVSGAKICLESNGSCFQMPDLKNGDVTYQFGLDPHVKILPKTGTSFWFLFDAMYSGGGSGTLTRYAILRTSGTSWSNLLPNVALTNVSDHALWTQPDFSAYPLLVTADFFWDFNAGETHLSKHAFTVDVWRYDQRKDIYTRVITYRTNKKYDGGDSVDTVSVIAPEQHEILRRLHSLIPNP